MSLSLKYIEGSQFDNIYYVRLSKWIFLFQIERAKECCFIYLYDKERLELFTDEYFFEGNSLLFYGLLFFLKELVYDQSLNNFIFEEELISRTFTIKWKQHNCEEVIFQIPLFVNQNVSIQNSFFKLLFSCVFSIKK